MLQMKTHYPDATRVEPSNRHTLAIVCHDGARAGDVAGFARRVRDGVADRFGVRLTPEPVFWGPVSLDAGG